MDEKVYKISDLDVKMALRDPSQDPCMNIEDEKNIKIITPKGTIFLPRIFEKIGYRFLRLPKTEILIDGKNKPVFDLKENRCFLLIQKTAKNSPVYFGDDIVHVLSPYKESPLSEISQKLFEYQEPKQVFGTYGKVKLFFTEKIAVKETVSKSNEFPSDFVKEICVYKYFENCDVFPKLYSFRQEQKIVLEFELGKNNLYDHNYFNLSEKEAKHIIFRLANILKLLNDHHIMHLDLKPSNCLIMEDGSIRLIDLGLIEHDSRKFQNKSKAMPVQTLWYRSPEVLAQYTRYDHRADVFSLGVMLIEMVTRKIFFPGKTDDHQSMLFLSKLFGEKFSNQEWKEAKEQKITIKSLQEKFCRYITEQNTSSLIKIQLAKMFPYLSEKLIDLSSKMLDFNPKKRISYREILEHDFFSDQIPMICPEIENLMPIIPNIEASYFPIGLKYRSSIFDWLSTIAEEVEESSEVLCLAFQILDLYVYKNPGKIDEKFIYIYALVSYVISAKIFFGADTYDMKWVAETLVIDPIQGSIIESVILQSLNGKILMPTIFTYWSRDYTNEEIFVKNYRNVINVYSNPEVYAKSLYARYKEISW